MKKLISLLALLFFTCSLISQLTINPHFEKHLDELIDRSVPIISVGEAFSQFEKHVFLDTRELEEYNISHISGAIYVGYDNFSFSNLKLEKDCKIILYCSVGYRSEIIGKILKKSGYDNVHNLYGSIFEWVNQGHPIIDPKGKTTNKLHTYSRSWSKWVDNPSIEKIW